MMYGNAFLKVCYSLMQFLVQSDMRKFQPIAKTNKEFRLSKWNIIWK